MLWLAEALWHAFSYVPASLKYQYSTEWLSVYQLCNKYDSNVSKVNYKEASESITGSVSSLHM